MKKIITATLTAVLIFLTTINVVCHAGDVTVTINGARLELPQSPVIKDGRTLVPFRGIFEAFGAEVGWDSKTRTVSGSTADKNIKLTIGSNTAYVNGAKKSLDVAPEIINDYTMVPVRFVSESLGAEVKWNGITRTVIINTSVDKRLIVTYADVGQGDCQIIQCGGETMIIDGGTADKSRTVVAVLKKLGVSYLDYVVSTHAHADHCGGLAGALKAFDAGAVIAPETEENSKSWKDFKGVVLSGGLEIINAKSGQKYALGNSTIEILGPITERTDDLNDTSVVLKITYGETSFLFTGDCEYDGEHQMLNSGANLKADVLKVGHHGSSGSSSYTFLREVMPKYAIIQAGKGNSYGHPHEEALSRLRDVGATVYRTDMQGDITLVSDGKNITVSVSRGENSITNPTQKPQAEAMYIGNLRSKKLHKSTCESLPAEDNRKYFNSRAEAIQDGYTPCKNCNP